MTAAAEAKVRRFLGRVDVELSQIKFFRQRTDRVWTRDFGPIFVTNGAGEVGYTHWRFNGWAKYDNWKRDSGGADEAEAQVAELDAARDTRAAVVLEGGGIDVNGDGLLLTTEECLLSDVQQRNPSFGREDGRDELPR